MTVFIAAPGRATLPVPMLLYIQDNIDPLVTSRFAAVLGPATAMPGVVDGAYGLDRLLLGRSREEE